MGSIADRTIAEADKDGDRAISFEEFTHVSLNSILHTNRISAAQSFNIIEYYSINSYVFNDSIYIEYDYVILENIIEHLIITTNIDNVL